MGQVDVQGRRCWHWIGCDDLQSLSLRPYKCAGRQVKSHDQGQGCERWGWLNQVWLEEWLDADDDGHSGGAGPTWTSQTCCIRWRLESKNSRSHAEREISCRYSSRFEEPWQHLLHECDVPVLKACQRAERSSEEYVASKRGRKYWWPRFFDTRIWRNNARTWVEWEWLRPASIHLNVAQCAPCLQWDKWAFWCS